MKCTPVREQGFTVVEVLIALAIIGVAFGALALSQVSNLQATTRSKLVTAVKAEANQVLEQTMAKVLQVEENETDTRYQDSLNTATGNWRSFYFIDYYYRCPTVVAPNGVRDGDTNHLRPGTAIECTGSQDTGPITTNWSIRGGSGVMGEGVLTVVVTSTHDEGATITLGDRITCYDVYPSPTSSAPEPCPLPTTAGGGR